jgi:hypothetical protein
MEEIKKEENLKDKMNAIEEKLDVILNTKPKKKSFKLPSKAKLSKSKVKANWVTVVKVNENKGVDFIREPIDNQTIVVDGVPRLCTGEDVLNYKGKPLIILPSWSVKPFSPSENYSLSIKDGSNTNGYALLLARMKAGAIDLKKKMNMWLIVGLVAVAGVVLYMVLKK